MSSFQTRCDDVVPDVQVTVAMPTYRRLTYALDALDSVLAQNTDTPFEILVMDNAVDPELERAVAQRQQSAAVPLRYVPVPEIGLHNGRHAAARRAAGELLLFIDDDIIADSQWLSGMVEAFADDEVQLATGPVLPQYEAAPPEWLKYFWHEVGQDGGWCGQLSLLDLGEMRQEIDTALVFGANFGVRKKALYELGGFHPDALPWDLRRYRGDGETAVSLAARDRGMKAVYHPRARVSHRVPAERLSLEYFERRAFLQGISDSFTDCRGQGNSLHRSDSNRQSLLRHLAGALGLLRRLLRDQTVGRKQQLRQRMQASHREGYRYHREMVKRDPSVREWVQRTDYWDAALPASATQ